MSAQENKPTFEECLKNLESIAQRIEKGEVGLEESIRLYEEGMKLVSCCRETLTQAEQRIRTLQTTNASTPILTEGGNLPAS